MIVPRRASIDALEAGFGIAERVAAKDSSNLYVTSRFFADVARYRAFTAMYAVMRLVDDAVDDVVDKQAAPAPVREALLRELDRWEARIAAAHDGRPGDEPLDHALAAAFATFPAPLRLWTRFVDAMRFDVQTPRFRTFEEFLDYGEGATVAPTALYVYLLTAERDPDGAYRTPFDYETCGRELGLFAYVAHVLRDVRVDLAVGQQGLFYFAAADLAAHGLDEAAVRAMIAAGAGDARWSAFVADLTARADAMRVRGDALATGILPALSRDRAFILRLIIDVYAELLRRIAAAPDAVLGPDPIVDDTARGELVRGAATRIGYALDRGASA